MNDNFKCIYKILCALEKSLDIEEFDTELISASTLEISETRWKKYLQMMQDAGYISGVDVVTYITGETRVNASQIAITLKGLEYLTENTIMQRMYKTAKGIVDIVPSIPGL